MHELSIAYNIVQIADDAAREAGVERVDAVHLRLGQLSGVVSEALLFGYDIAAQGTRLEGSRLEIEDVPVVIFCAQCRAERELESIQVFCCPECGTPSMDIRSGNELEIGYVEYSDEPAHS
ncbi:MAG: hydrogenase maturation nickel metallochaperone HypA [Chloroflexi bacterium]|nr:hydrogenase maturation nickel metallochaperone HypA [Chloroflexota bacterium]